MKLAILVTEYPKTTETFILRDVMTFLNAGADVRLYHLAPYRHGEILHDFAAPTRALALHHGFAGRRALGGLARHLSAGASRAAAIIRAQAAEPLLMAKSLALVPAASAIADDLVAWGADHVHAEFAGHPATAAWIIHKLTGLPYSVSCRAHDIFRTQRLLKEKLGDAAFVRTVSHYARNFLGDRVPGLDMSRVEVIHSSVDLDVLPPLGPPPTEPFHILYVGSLQIRKGVDILLHALARLDVGPWVCTLAGGGPERARLEALAKSLGLDDRVRFLGNLGFDAITKLYAKASVVVAPSIIGPKGRTEGIPNVMIEALAFQRPAISTNISGIPELIRDGVTGRLIAPGSVDALSTALQEIHADPAGAYRMAVAGRAHVQDEFSLQVNALRQLRLFELHSNITHQEAS